MWYVFTFSAGVLAGAAGVIYRAQLAAVVKRAYEVIQAKLGGKP